MPFLGKILATVIGGTILDKIRRNRMPDPKPVIGSGTAPTLDSGIPLELAEIEGTVAPTPEQAAEMDTAGVDFDNLPAEEQEKLLMQLLQQENDGIMGMYHGGKIHNYSSGGALGGLFGLGFLDNIDTLIDLPEILDDVKDRFPKATDFFTNLDPEIKEILGDTAAEGLLALLKKYDEPRGSIVSTRTLPAGNANRRRMMIKQIGMQDGGDVLDRKMFKPMLGGGELDGPGGPKDDMIPIMASDGEFMLSKATVDMLGGGNHSKGIAALEKINNKGNRMYG
jgi:hypothetical protein|tara:strand:+ start:82 stop:924 length:843 start_codon:yes stop_codon:yes gene_type:complete